MPLRPLLVAVAPRRYLPATLVHDPVGVGVLRARAAALPVARHPGLSDWDRWLTVAIVAALPLPGDGSGRFGPRPRLVPSDLVPLRLGTDVLLRGGADAGPVILRVGDVERRLRTAAAVGRANLASDLVTGDGIPAPSRVPLPPARVGPTRWFEEEGLEAFHAAPAPLRLPRLRGDETVTVETSGRRVELVLPGVVPRVRAIGGMIGIPDQELWAELDEVLLDLDAGQARLVFRALVATSRDDARDVDRLDVQFCAPPAEGSEGEPFFDRDLPRGQFFHAWELEQAERGEAPAPLPAEDVEVARYETWDHAGPLPVLPLEKAARISAELAEQREPRDQVLARHELSRHDWDLEERAWAEAISETPAPDAAATLAELWARAFEDAQESLARAEETAWAASDWARATAALEGPEPERALAGAGMGLGGYQRLDRRLSRRALEDPAFAEELDRELEAARRDRRGRASGGRAPDDDDDDDDGVDA